MRRRDVERSDAVVVARVDGHALAHEEGHVDEVAADGRLVHARRRLLQLQHRAPLLQLLRHLGVAPRHGVGHGRTPPAIARVDLRTEGAQQAHHGVVARGRGEVKRRAAVKVPGVDIEAAGDKAADGAQLARGRRGEHLRERRHVTLEDGGADGGLHLLELFELVVVHVHRNVKAQLLARGGEAKLAQHRAVDEVRLLGVGPDDVLVVLLGEHKQRHVRAARRLDRVRLRDAQKECRLTDDLPLAEVGPHRGDVHLPLHHVQGACNAPEQLVAPVATEEDRLVGHDEPL
mmetsp:Transcript_18860/g.55308  ORF Transcript_18860/g.55308 Transcript_18860/m.55308 type:complete len:289 (+) Transcript_18860:6208-7074(+)